MVSWVLLGNVLIISPIKECFKSPFKECLAYTQQRKHSIHIAAYTQQRTHSNVHTAYTECTHMVQTAHTI